MVLKLQTESPADSDIFKGESHEKVAEKMAEVIEKSDINIIGLEGELGSGKSTILHFLQKKLNNNFTFINFDAERYHYGSTKKALIEVIHEGISDKCPTKKEELDKFKNQALGNIVEYDKKVNSRLNWSTVIFILLSLLSVQMLRYTLADLNKYLSNNETFNTWLFCIEVIAVLSPVVFILFIARLQKYKWYKEKGFSSVGDLFKRNSVDRIEETWLVNKEIGAIELSKALEGFTSESVIENNRFILIIDNLDRVNADKVKELWSDMELISGATHNNFRIVVPYSARQVSASLDLEGYSGREFIAKRIPVCFHVPPLISAGWQEAFNQFWNETVKENDENSCREVAALLERWKPAEYPRITPRLMKKFVNDIHVIDLTISAEESYRHILIALYLLVVKYSDIDIKRLLRKANDENNSVEINIPPDEIDAKLNANLQQLSRIFGDDANRWSEFLMCVHYQTNIDIARSELLDEPLIQAITERDKNKLESLLSLWGFSQSWIRSSNKINPIDWIVVVSKISKEYLYTIEKEIDFSLKTLSYTYARDKKEIFNESFVNGLIYLIENKLVFEESFIKRQSNYIANKLDFFNKSDHNIDRVDGDVFSLIEEADLYSIINKESIFNMMEYYINGWFYVDYLVGNENKYPNLKIDEIYLPDTSIKEMLCHVIKNEDGDVFSASIMRHINLYTRVVKEIIEEDDLDEVNEALIMLKGHVDGYDQIKLRKIIFSKEWSKNNLISYYTNKSISGDFGVEFVAQAIAHMIISGNISLVNTYSEYIDKPNFHDYMRNYLRYSNSFDKVIQVLNNDLAMPFISNSIKEIINNNETGFLSPLDYIYTHYDLIKKHIPDSNPMIVVENREAYIFKNITYDSISKLGAIFVCDLLSLNNAHDLKNKLFELSNDIFNNNEKLTIAFFSLHENQITIFKSMKKPIHMNENIAVFSDWYRNASEEDLNNAENIYFLWSLLEDEQRKEIINQLHDVLLERNVSISNRTKIIHHFGDSLKFKELEGREDRRGVAALFNASLEDDVLREWLNQQEFSFSKWSQDDQDTATRCILDNQDKFPEICKKSQFIQNRIKEDKTKKENIQDSEEIAES